MFQNMIWVICSFCVLSIDVGRAHADLGQRQESEDTSNICRSSAACTLSGQISKFGWRQISASGTFTAFTIVTIINTVSNITKTSTILAQAPEDFTPPPTNSDGNRVATLTYNANGVNTTTTVVYPTVFYDWDTQYAVEGQYALTHPDGESECVDLGTTSTFVPISGDPQPGPPLNTDPPITTGRYADPLGWGYTLEWDHGEGSYNLHSMIDLLPEAPDLPHSVVTSCAYDSSFPVNPKFDAPWMAVGANSVKYVGDEDDGEISSSKPGPPAPTPGESVSKTTPLPSTAPVPSTATVVSIIAPIFSSFPISNSAPNSIDTSVTDAASGPDITSVPDTSSVATTAPVSSQSSPNDGFVPGDTSATNDPVQGTTTKLEISPTYTSPGVIVTALAMSFRIPMSTLTCCIVVWAATVLT